MHKTLVDAEIKVNISGGWTPTPQRENDRVIMDLAKKHTPEWTWDRINRCRLFLQATTTTDITSIEGRFIPMRVREVRNPLRQNNLQFPLQKRPAKGDIRHWRYLVECISQNGHLNTPLGHWTRHPDQKFCHLYLPSTDVMYKRTKDRWEIFGKTKQGTRRYLQRNFYVGEPPKDSIPVKVIDGVRYIILPQKDEIIRYNRHKQGQFTQNIVQKEIDKAVLGTYQIYPEQKEKLQEIWNIGGTLICATDGGLKDTMGTSSYVFYLPNDLQPIVEGLAGEYQPIVTASSTRQELLGQLGMELWLQRFYDWWGHPKNVIEVALITDSKSSIEIISNVSKTMGIKDTMRAETDIALEIRRYHRKNKWIHRTTIKVDSHIEKDLSPNPFYWECNERTDGLATGARDTLPWEAIKKTHLPVLPGTKASCRIGGRNINNDLFESIKEHMMGTELKRFLMQKYGWTETQFEKIAWEEHKGELLKYSALQKVTLIKYLHGWLATNVRKACEGKEWTPKCPMCGEVDTQRHFLYCSNVQMKQIRMTRWSQYMKNIGEKTSDGCKQIFQAGVMTIVGKDPPTERDRRDWPSTYRKAYKEQEEIGWEQVLSGRLVKQWKAEDTNRDVQSGTVTTRLWTQQIIRMSWNVGLDLWKSRNKMVHGMKGTTSNTEIENTAELARALYDTLRPTLAEVDRTLFPEELSGLMGQSHQCQLAWIEQMKFLYPE